MPQAFKVGDGISSSKLVFFAEDNVFNGINAPNGLTFGSNIVFIGCLDKPTLTLTWTKGGSNNFDAIMRVVETPENTSKYHDYIIESGIMTLSSNETLIVIPLIVPNKPEANPAFIQIVVDNKDPARDILDLRGTITGQDRPLSNAV